MKNVKKVFKYHKLEQYYRWNLIIIRMVTNLKQLVDPIISGTLHIFPVNLNKPILGVQAGALHKMLVTTS